MFANPPLAEAALYVCILASLMAFWDLSDRRGVPNWCESGFVDE
jgi:hypothetical protein